MLILHEGRLIIVYKQTDTDVRNDLLSGEAASAVAAFSALRERVAQNIDEHLRNADRLIFRLYP